ncbi:MAG TPA: hypothetical protein VGM22_24830 [Methylomirabilota bacterium]|jgi:hypothetical protein
MQRTQYQIHRIVSRLLVEIGSIRSHQFEELPVQALNCWPGDWYFPAQVPYWASLWLKATQSIVKLAQGTPTGPGRGARIGCRPEVMEKVLNEVWRHQPPHQNLSIIAQGACLSAPKDFVAISLPIRCSIVPFSGFCDRGAEHIGV